MIRFVEEIEKKANGNVFLFSQNVPRFMTPTQWFPKNPALGLLAGGASIGGLLGALNDNDGGKLDDAAVGSGLGAAGTMALARLGVFDQMQKGTNGKKGEKSNQPGVTGVEGGKKGKIKNIVLDVPNNLTNEQMKMFLKSRDQLNLSQARLNALQEYSTIKNKYLAQEALFNLASQRLQALTPPAKKGFFRGLLGLFRR